MDGADCYAQLRAFLKRIERRYGEVHVIWKREFQRRGSLHYHLAWLVPDRARRLERDRQLLRDLRRWTDVTWNAVAGQLRSAPSTRVQVLRGSPAGYLSVYLAKQRRTKEYQHQIPDGFVNPGRWWGRVGLARTQRCVPVAIGDYFRVRRVLRRARRGLTARRIPNRSAQSPLAGLSAVGHAEGCWQPLLRLLTPLRL
jgi:hypothetical protein